MVRPVKAEPSIFDQLDEEADARRYAEAVADVGLATSFPTMRFAPGLRRGARLARSPRRRRGSGSLDAHKVELTR